MHIKTINNRKKIIIILILIFLFIGIILCINYKKTPPIRPIIGIHHYQIDENILMHTGTVKSVQNKSITLEIDGKQVDFDVSPRVLIFNVSNSNKDTILQLNNTVVVRFRMEGNINNEAISISKIDFTGSLLNPRADVVIDKNIILLNGSPDKDSFDIVGDITEIDGGNITIKAELTGEYIVFDTNNSNFLVALNTDISNITSQTLAKIWAKETNSHFKSALVTLYR